MPEATTALPNGETVPTSGQGTWCMGEAQDAHADEVRALAAGRRDEVFIASKVDPHNASRRGVVAACEASLERLGTDRVDLYLLHWRGRYPLAETVAGFAHLRAQGKIRHWGVSNFDGADMAELWATEGGRACAANQILFNVTRRGPEWDLLPWCRGHGLPVMANSPIEQGRLPAGVLDDIGRRHGVDRHAVALARVLAQENVIAIPKASRLDHVERNARAGDLVLTSEDLAAIDAAFPPPRKKTPLAIR